MEPLSGLPFMLAAGAVQAPMDRNKVIEAVITAAISGAIIAAVGYFFALPVLQEQMAQVKVEVASVKVDVKELRGEIKEDRVRVAAELRISNDRMQRMEIEAARRGAQK